MARRLHAEQRLRARQRCEADIESARAAVFAAEDGVVSSRMTELEREWRRLSRTDRDGGLMDLWAKIAPPSWIDRKRWRDSPSESQLDVAVALAADADGIDAAEHAVGALRGALAAWGMPVGARVRWRPFADDAEPVTSLLAAPLHAARESLAALGVEAIVVERAQQVERRVLEAAASRFPERPLMSQGLAHAAFVDGVWRAAPPNGRANPVAALSALWMTGYVLAAVDATGVTLELPPL